jgi:hypothetical protein
MRGHHERCAICRAPTKQAIVGNRLLWHTDVSHLPPEDAPSVAWRCEGHQRYKMRPASEVKASELGNLFFTLTCGHQVQWVFRGRLAYTSALIERRLSVRQLRLDQEQRCYLCADRERENKARQEPGQSHERPTL